MNESMDRALADWLREGPEHGSREALERALAATRRTPQRPGWTFPERWLPMQTDHGTDAVVASDLVPRPRGAPDRRIGRGGTLRRLAGSRCLSRSASPATGWSSSNRTVICSIADGLDGPTRTLIAGPETDSFPLFSRQGDRLAFVRDNDDGFQLMSVRPDGTDVKGARQVSRAILTASPGRRTAAPSSSTSRRPTTPASGWRSSRQTGPESRELSLGRAADWASWRPDGRQVAFRGALGDGTSGAFIADADGMNVRRLPIDTTDLVDFEGLSWTPDGTRLSFMSAGSLGGTTMNWQIGIATIDAGGTLTDLQWLRLDPESRGETYPTGRRTAASSRPSWRRAAGDSSRSRLRTARVPCARSAPTSTIAMLHLPDLVAGRQDARGGGGHPNVRRPVLLVDRCGLGGGDPAPALEGRYLAAPRALSPSVVSRRTPSEPDTSKGQIHHAHDPIHPVGPRGSGRSDGGGHADPCGRAPWSSSGMPRSTGRSRISSPAAA